jgi:cell pole-organizing protein PopZ
MPPRERTVVPDVAATPVEPAKPVTNGAAPADLAEPDILDLTEDMAAEPPMPAPQPEPASSNFRTIDGQPDVFFAESPAEPEPVREPEPPARMPPRPAPALESLGFDDRSSTIISQATSAAVDSAFSQLAQSVFTQNGRTIEDLVREMMRPMLKAWLDDNLPGLVERLVRAEIERVSRGRS